MDSAGYITLSFFSHKILVSDFPTQNSCFVFLMKTISLIVPYFDCGLRGIFFESEKSLAEVSFGKGFISAVWCPYLNNENEENMRKAFIPCFDA